MGQGGSRLFGNDYEVRPYLGYLLYIKRDFMGQTDIECPELRIKYWGRTRDMAMDAMTRYIQRKLGPSQLYFTDMMYEYSKE
jgi:hypothetical protein